MHEIFRNSFMIFFLKKNANIWTYEIWMHGNFLLFFLRKTFMYT